MKHRETKPVAMEHGGGASSAVPGQGHGGSWA